jgi:hypothetical protein
VLVLRLLTMRLSQRKTAAPFKPIPTGTAVKQLSAPNPPMPRLFLDRPRRREAASRHLIRRRHRRLDPVSSYPTAGGGPSGKIMLGIPRRYSHFVFGTIQAGLTSLIAAGIASAPFISIGNPPIK